MIKFNTCAGNSTFVYDAENRMYAGNGWTFAYYFDALGRRTRRISPSGTSDYFYDLGGRVGLEVNGSTGTANRMEVYALGRHLATYSNGTTYLSHSDLLGTERVRSNGSGGTAESYANLPFGDFMQPSGNGVSPMHFTGQERDPETGLDHFLFRYYNSTQGHWMTPDPAGLAAVDLSNPQSLNRYAYVLNAPTSYVDPLGLLVANPCYEGTRDICDEAMGMLLALVSGGGLGRDPGPADNTGGGGGDDSRPPVLRRNTANNGQQSFADCVKSGTDYFNLQNGLKAISGGRLVTSWVSSAFLSSNISNFITLGQYVSSRFSGSSGPSLLLR